MKNKYLFTLILTLIFSLNTQAQESKSVAKNTDQSELGIYPNPATQGKIYITSKNSLSKEITIYDVVGKVVLQTTITNKELNISSIQQGMYLIQIKEGETVVTRKLIIK
jgi:Secretion system C-terminal sorting domain